MTYPHVLGELETLRAVLAGRSLARFGDGEFRLCEGGGLKCQLADPVLAQRLRGILHDSGDCLVGIPNIHSDTPKAAHWRGYTYAARLLAARPYVSAFISRPDSAPWINTVDYWTALESLWRGHDVTVVRGCDSEKGLRTSDLTGARRVREIACPSKDAFREYDEILARIGTPARVLLCLGPTATVLAVDLAANGVHAVDLGHVGLFLRKARRGDPMTVTAADKALV